MEDKESSDTEMGLRGDILVVFRKCENAQIHNMAFDISLNDSNKASRTH